MQYFVKVGQVLNKQSKNPQALEIWAQINTFFKGDFFLYLLTGCTCDEIKITWQLVLQEMRNSKNIRMIVT